MAAKGYKEPESVPDSSDFLPRGLFWRNGILWINKTINGQRHQLSTGARTTEDGLKEFQAFLDRHGVDERRRAKEEAAERPPLPKGLYWKGNVIWLSRKVAGKHHNVSTGTSDPKLAEQFLADFNLKAFKGEILGVRIRKKLPFEELADRYIEQGKLDGLRKKTVARYSAVRDHFMEFLSCRGLAESHAADISPDVVEDYKAWRSSTPVNRNGYPVADVRQADRQGAASKTLQLEVQTIGTFFRYAVRLGLVEENPVARIRGVRVVSKAPVYLDEEEIPRFLDAARTFDQWARPQRQCGTLFHDIFLVYLKTGMRLEELRHLEWSDVDLRRGEITIRPEKEVKEDREIPLSAAAAGRLRRMGPAGFARLSLEERQDLLGRRLQSPNQLGELQFGDFDLKKGILRRRSKVNWNPKTRGRAIPISAKLAGLLAGLPKGSNLVFPDPNGGGMWRFRVNDLVKRCARQAGITKNIHTHTLRHTFATQLRQRGVPLETIKELLGHADIRETLIYAHFSPEEARAAIPKIDFF